MDCLRAVSLFIVAALTTGCSTLGVKIDSRPERVPKRESPARFATASPGEGFEQLLEAARRALASQNVADYNAAVGRIVTLAAENRFTNLPPDLVLDRRGEEVLDPSGFDALTPAGSVRIKGLIHRSTQDGLGVPCVGWVRRESPLVAGQPGIPKAGMSFPVTAYVRFDGRTAHLRFQSTLRSDHALIDGRRMRLAADFSASIAILLSHGKNRSIDLRALFFTDREFGKAGLFQFQPYDPNKIPVVFVHGLISRPEAWTQALNGLLADPKVRERYQFWFYLYPTGLPVWKSAAVLRSELDRFHRALETPARNPRLHEMVLVGHSMGGLISSLMIREGGDRLWRQFSNVPSRELKLSPSAKREILDLVYFAPREDVHRVIFVATPHRGSNLALNPMANFGAGLIRLPVGLGKGDREEFLRALRDDSRSLFVAPANSVRFLRAKSPLLLSIMNLPISPKVPYHSIIGDRGRGSSPNSSDGVVPYWSSHLDGARSEKIVPSGHGANENPRGIEEIRRILRLNLEG